jgi:hypothetical protein
MNSKWHPFRNLQIVALVIQKAFYKSLNIGPLLKEHEISMMQHSLKWVSLIKDELVAMPLKCKGVIANTETK